VGGGSDGALEVDGATDSVGRLVTVVGTNAVGRADWVGVDVGLGVGRSVALRSGISAQVAMVAKVSHVTSQLSGSIKQADVAVLSCARRGPPSGQTRTFEGEFSMALFSATEMVESNWAKTRVSVSSESRHVRLDSILLCSDAIIAAVIWSVSESSES